MAVDFIRIMAACLFSEVHILTRSQAMDKPGPLNFFFQPTPMQHAKALPPVCLKRPARAESRPGPAAGLTIFPGLKISPRGKCDFPGEI